MAGMEISPNVLRRDTVQTYQRAQKMLEAAELDDGLAPLQQAQLVASLLQTKSQCLNTLTLLSEQGKRR